MINFTSPLVLSPVADTAQEVGDVILPESVGVPSGAVYAFFIDYVYGDEQVK